MKWKGIIFDRDGTLFDSFAVILGAFNYAIEPFTSKRPTASEWFAAFGPAEPEVIEKIIGPEKKHEAFERFYSYYNEHFEQISLFPGVEKILERLHTASVKIALFTGGGWESTHLALTRTGIVSYFDVLITGDRVKNPKPDPEGILLALSSMKIAADETLGVGDAGSDVIAGQKAGLKTALVRWSAQAPPSDLPSRPDYTFYSVSEFETFLFGEEK